MHMALVRTIAQSVGFMILGGAICELIARRWRKPQINPKSLECLLERAERNNRVLEETLAGTRAEVLKAQGLLIQQEHADADDGLTPVDCERNDFVIRANPFVLRMYAELQANAHKGNWDEWHPSSREFHDELMHHVEKLDFEIISVVGDPSKIGEYAADVAVICMKAFELYQ